MVLSDRIVAALEAGDDAEALRQVRVSRAFLADHILSWFDTFQDLALLLLETRFYRGILKISKGFFLEDAELLDAIAVELEQRLEAREEEVTWTSRSFSLPPLSAASPWRNSSEGASGRVLRRRHRHRQSSTCTRVLRSAARHLEPAVLSIIQKCELSLALFVVVMFIGCLNRGGRAYHWLKPVRSELSIVAWFLSLGHMAVYLESYLPRLLGGGEIGGNVMAPSFWRSCCWCCLSCSA